MPTVIPFPELHAPSKARVVEPLTIEQFCAADAGRDWDFRSSVNGMTILHYPRALMICDSEGACCTVRQQDTCIDCYFEEVFEALEVA